jgi:hypothetical protein
MAVMAERIQAMKAIWAEDEASFQGRHVSFERIWSWPKPAQRPHPPILVGGEGPTVLDRVLAFGDAWFPNYGAADFFERATDLRARAERPIDVQVIGIPADARVIDEMERAGVSRVVHWVPSGGRSVIQRALERFEAAVAEAHGE